MIVIVDATPRRRRPNGPPGNASLSLVFFFMSSVVSFQQQLPTNRTESGKTDRFEKTLRIWNGSYVLFVSDLLQTPFTNMLIKLSF